MAVLAIIVVLVAHPAGDRLRAATIAIYVVFVIA